MSATLTDEALFNIETSIKKNKFYYDGVLDDPAFIPFRPQIMVLRTKLFNNVKKQNEDEVANLYFQYKLIQLFELIKSQELPSNTKSMIENIKLDMDLIGQRTKKNTYVGYIDNIELIHNMEKRLDLIKNDLLDFKRILETRLSYLTDQLKTKKRDMTITKNYNLWDKISASLLFLLSIPGICLVAISLIDSDFFEGEDALVGAGILSLSLAVLVFCLLYYEGDNYNNTQNDFSWLINIVLFILSMLIIFIICFVILAILAIAFSIIELISKSTAELLELIAGFIILVPPPILSFKLLYVSLHESRKEKEVQDNYKNTNKQLSDVELLLKELSKIAY